jgi:hypothetical protein
VVVALVVVQAMEQQEQLTLVAVAVVRMVITAQA